MKTKTQKKNNNQDWEVKRLGEVCKLVKGKKPGTFSKIGAKYLTAKVIRGTKNPEYTEDKNVVYIDTNDIIIIMDGSNSGELFRNLDGVLASTMGVLDFDKEEFDARFFLYFLMGHREEFTKSRTGSAIPHLNKDQFNDLLIPIILITEQKRIVKILDEAFENIEKARKIAEKNLENIKELFESYLQGVFEEGGDGWEEKGLGEICEIARGGSPRPIKEFITNDGSGVNWIKIGDVAKGSKYITSTNQKIKKSGVQRSRMVYPGNFLLSNSMSFGRPYILKIEGCIHDGWLVLTLDENIIDSDFLYYFLSSKTAYSQLDKMAQGSTVRNINIDIAGRLQISYPKSLKTQKRIVKKLDALSEKVREGEAIFQRKIAVLDELKKSVLKKAFAGEL